MQAVLYAAILESKILGSQEDVNVVNNPCNDLNDADKSIVVNVLDAEQDVEEESKHDLALHNQQSSSQRKLDKWSSGGSPVTKRKWLSKIDLPSAKRLQMGSSASRS